MIYIICGALLLYIIIAKVIFAIRYYDSGPGRNVNEEDALISMFWIFVLLFLIVSCPFKLLDKLIWNIIVKIKGSDK